MTNPSRVHSRATILDWYGVRDYELSLICPYFASHQETERLVADSPPGIEAHPHEDNLRYFDVKIRGPDGSAFEGMSCSCRYESAVQDLIPSSHISE
jgi:hypothetical protein